MNQPLESTVTVSQLLRTMEKTDSQSVTLFRNGSGHFVMGRFSAPAFHSLPELSKFVDEIAARPVALISGGVRDPERTSTAISLRHFDTPPASSASVTSVTSCSNSVPPSESTRSTSDRLSRP